MKIRPVGDEFFHAHRRIGRQTYMTILIVTFRNFANASEKYTEFAFCFFMVVKLVFVLGREKKTTKLEAS